MKYSIEILREANKIVDQRRLKALSTFEKNKSLAYETIPQLYEIDSELSTSGLQISKEIILNGADAKNSINKIRNRNSELINAKKNLLKQNNFSEDFLSIPYFCKKCNDTGYVDAMPCECLKEILSEISKKQAVDNSKNNDCTFENFNLDYYPENLNGIDCKNIMAVTFKNCKEYAENFSKESPNILIFGATGIGKTHISLAISRVVFEKGFNVIYMSAPDLFSSLEKERFNQEKPVETLESLTECDLLIIDDLGAEFTTSFTTSMLYNIINTRILMCLPTIITANLIPSELQQRYGERIASRLIGCYEHLRFLGSDIRIIKKKEQ